MGLTFPDLIPYPESGDHTRLWEHFQNLAEGVQAALGTDTGWLPLPLNAAWDDGAVAPEYRVRHGTVYLRGQVDRASGSVATVGTLPSGARPTAAMLTLARSAGTGLALGISSSGVLTISGGYVNGDAVSLDTIAPFRND